jgi:hypothetical protein
MPSGELAADMGVSRCVYDAPTYTPFPFAATVMRNDRPSQCYVEANDLYWNEYQAASSGKWGRAGVSGNGRA